MLEELAWQSGLADDRLQRADADLVVQRDGHRYGRRFRALLHDDMTAALPDLLEPLLHQQPAKLAAGEDAEPTQSRPRRA